MSLAKHLSVESEAGVPNTDIHLVGYVKDGDNGSFSLDLTSLTGGIASYASTDDIVVVVSAESDNSSGWGVSTAGYTTHVSLTANDTKDTTLKCQYKVMGATPDTSVSLSGGAAPSYSRSAIAMVFRNVLTSNPIETAYYSEEVINTCRVANPTITPTRQDAMIVYGLASGHSDGTLPEFTITSSTASKLYEVGVSVSIAECSTASGYELWDNSSETSISAVLATADSTSYSACTFALALTHKDWVEPTTTPTITLKESIYANGVSTDLIFASAPAENEYIYAVCTSNKDASFSTVPSGFTLLYSYTTNDEDLFLYRKVAGASESTTYSWKAGDEFSVSMISVENVVTETVGTHATTTGETLTTIPSVTTYDGGLLLMAAILDNLGEFDTASTINNGSMTMEEFTEGDGVDDYGGSAFYSVEVGATGSTSGLGSLSTVAGSNGCTALLISLGG